MASASPKIVLSSKEACVSNNNSNNNNNNSSDERADKAEKKKAKKSISSDYEVKSEAEMEKDNHRSLLKKIGSTRPHDISKWSEEITPYLYSTVPHIEEDSPAVPSEHLAAATTTTTTPDTTTIDSQSDSNRSHNNGSSHSESDTTTHHDTPTSTNNNVNASINISDDNNSHTKKAGVSFSPASKSQTEPQTVAPTSVPHPHTLRNMEIRKRLGALKSFTEFIRPDEYKIATKQISAALSEYYRFLDILRNYHILNHTALAKILKKHDKTTGFSTLDICLDKLRSEPFMTQKDVLQQLIHDTEALYTEFFCKGNRRTAMQKLRLTDEDSITIGSTLRIGLLAGFCLPLYIIIFIIIITQSDNYPNWTSIWIMYRGLLLPIYMLWLLAADMWVFNRKKINYVFIFDFDSRDHLNFVQVFEIAAFLNAIWCVSVLCFLFENQINFIPGEFNPLALAVFIVLYLVNPFNVFHRSARYWVLRTFGRVCASPFTKVRFADFWFGDQLTSLVVAILDWEFLLCFYILGAHDFNVDTCTSVRYGIRPVLTILPAFFRLMQCLRRYYDSKAKFPHLVNAGKYFSTICVGSIASIDASIREQSGQLWNGFRITWIVVSVIAACYAYTWDVKMDWGLMERRYKFLRKEIVYPRIVYYFAIVLDLGLRFLWIITIAPQNFGIVLNSQIFTTCLAFVEVTRRCVWNLFRLENEHLNNCGQFRVVHDVPLPFNKNIASEDDDEDDIAMGHVSGTSHKTLPEPSKLLEPSTSAHLELGFPSAQPAHLKVQ